MIRLVLVITLLGMAAHASSGVWVLSDGSTEQRECPPRDLFEQAGEMNKGLKLPSGCVAEAPGRWTSVETWKSEQEELAALREKVSRLETRLEELEGRRLAEALTCARSLVRADNCSCPTWPYWATASVGGVAAVTGALCTLRGM